MTENRNISRYLELFENRPDLFPMVKSQNLITDMDTLSAYESEHDRPLGVVYESGYHTFLVDLVRDNDGTLRPIERLVQTHTGHGVVIVPSYGNRFLLLRQYRHTLGQSIDSFPRGFGEDGLSPEDNAAKELSEEVGVAPKNLHHIGSMISDTGLSGDTVDVFECEIDAPRIEPGYEGIDGIRFVTFDELKADIAAGRIVDGFTLAAFSFLSVSRM